MIYTDIPTIEKIAARHKISINQLCEMAGVDRSTFTRIKNTNTKRPLLDTFTKLSAVLVAAEKRKNK